MINFRLLPFEIAVASLALASLLQVSTFAQSVVPEVDQRYEDRLARINEGFNQSQVSDEEWAKIAGTKSSERYTLGPGDTLWDISEKFFGSGYYWPKVWELNDKITNPHIVAIGGTLGFSPGSDVAPPALSVLGSTATPTGAPVTASTKTQDDDSEDTEEFSVADQNNPDEIVRGEIVIPKGRKESPLVDRIPPSFPEWKGDIYGEFDKNGFSTNKVEMVRVPRTTTGYISTVASAQPWGSVGQVSEMEGTRTVAATYQKLFVTIPGGANVGDIFTVYAVGKDITEPDTKKVMGVVIHIRGTIKIVEATSVSNTYGAIVTKTFGILTIGDKLVAGNVLVKTTYDDHGPSSVIGARILGSSGESAIDSEEYIYGLHQVVYLDRGEADGVQVGSILNVFKNYHSRNPDTELMSFSDKIAKIKIVKVDDRIATAVVVKGIDPIMPGDETGVLPDSGQNSTKPDSISIEDAPAS